MKKRAKRNGGNSIGLKNPPKSAPSTQHFLPWSYPSSSGRLKLIVNKTGFPFAASTYRNIHGVISTAAGYTGGSIADPTYRQVCSDRTGHAEAVQVMYDPEKVSYEKLLAVFWNIHDPTTLNRQGPDVGTQYRSAIFYHTDRQKELSEASKQKLSEHRNIVTQIIPAAKFYAAEEYHQFYLHKILSYETNL